MKDVKAASSGSGYQPPRRRAGAHAIRRPGRVGVPVRVLLATDNPLHVQLCVDGSATPGTDYDLYANGVQVSSSSSDNASGKWAFSTVIPAGALTFQTFESTTNLGFQSASVEPLDSAAEKWCKSTRSPDCQPEVFRLGC